MGTGGAGGGPGFSNPCGLPLPASIGAATGLIDLGHTTELDSLARSGDRVLSHEGIGERWILWDTTTRTGVASGMSHPFGYVGIKKNLVVIQAPTGLELRDAATGQLQASIAGAPISFAQIGIADDGSYAWAAMVGGGLAAWSAQGTQLVNVTGDYSNASIFAAPTELRVAKGPAGVNRIESIALGGGAATLSPVFSQGFHSWMLDGERFFAVVGNAVFIFSKNATLVASAVLPTTEQLGGTGDYFWTFPSFVLGYPLRIYKVGSGDTPIATHACTASTRLFPSKQGIGLSDYGPGQFDIVHFDPQATKETVTVPYPYLSAIALDDVTGWTVSNRNGVILQHGSSQNPQDEGTLGCGRVFDMAGTQTGRAAVTIASNRVLILDMNAGGVIENVLPLWAEKVGISDDGSVLATWEGGERAQYFPWFHVTTYALPAGTEQHVFPESWWFSLSRDGTRIGFTERVPVTRHVMDINGTTTFFDDISGVMPSPQPSPNGANIAVPAGPVSTLAATYLYQANPLGGAPMLVNSVPGNLVGWINDDRLLVYTMKSNDKIGLPDVYDKSIVYDALGNAVATPAIPVRIFQLEVASVSAIYSPDKGAVYDWTTGATLWTNPLTSTMSAAAGSQVVTSYRDGIYAAPF